MGFEIYNTWNTPNWSMPMFGDFNNSFNFSNENIWTMPSSSTTTSTTASTDNETYEQYKKRMEKEAKEAETSSGNAELNTIKEDKLKELKITETLGKAKAEKAQLEKSKKADGSGTKRTPYKKQGFWGKAARWGANLLTAGLNMGKQLLGFEKDGKWNWKKCLTNVGLTALCFVPYVGPVARLGLATAGLIGGGKQLVEGIKQFNKVKNSDNDEAIDNAIQDILGGGTIIIGSTCGLRAIGKGATNAVTSQSRTSLVGKGWQKSTQFLADTFVNPFKATVQAVKADAVSISQNGLLGSFKQSTSNLKNKETMQKQEINNSINERLTKIDAKIKELQEWQKLNGKLSQNDKQYLATLKEEKFLLERNKSEMSNFFEGQIKEKAIYDNLKENNSGAKAITRMENRSVSANPNKIQGQVLSDKQIATFYSRITKQQNAYNKALNKLIDTQNRVMRRLAEKPNQNLVELNRYVPNREKLTWWQKNISKKNTYQVAITDKKISMPDLSKGKALITPTITVTGCDNLFTDSVHSAPFFFGEDYTKDEFEAEIKNYDAQIALLEEATKKFDNCKNVEEVNALVKSLQEETTQSAEETAPSPEKPEENQEEEQAA